LLTLVIALVLLVVAVGAAINVPHAGRSRHAGAWLTAVIAATGVANLAVILTSGSNAATVIVTLTTGLTLAFALYRWAAIIRLR
jgi:hypothetical protein